MTINNKNNSIQLTDLLESGKNMGLKKKKCMDIIAIAANTIEKFANFAMEMGLREKTYESIQKILNQNKIEL